MFKEITALWCQCDKCNHEWLAWKPTGIPLRCAKCKSRKWNGGQFSVDLLSIPVTTFQEGDIVTGLPGFDGPARVGKPASPKHPKNSTMLPVSVRNHEHDRKTCRVYKCLMCQKVKGAG